MTQVEEIKRRTDIVELVGETVPLKSSGRNFKANCPFHNERTPSFYIFPERQSWHCFGACAAGGDVLSFVMRRDGILFGEALRLLADRAGVALAPPQAAREKADRQERLKGLNREAAMFFRESLLTSNEARAARDYLEKRGLDPQTIEDYRLGYSPENPEALRRHLSQESYSDQDLMAAGLVRQREDGSGLYSFFRGRLMIPIQDARADYLGFGARALDDSGPKYINSPQSDLFDKGSILYGLHRAVDAIKEEGSSIIVEGYMDVLTAHRHGFRNVVASMGTALTERQVGALKRLGSVFVLALDPDAAGDEATLRSLESSWRILDRPSARAPQGARLTGQDTEPEFILRVMDLPRGRDPDDLIREDPEQWRDLVAAARPVIDYVFGAVAGRFDIATSRGKASVAQRLAPFIRNAPSIFESNDRIRKLAVMLKEGENIVRLAIAGPTAGRQRGASKGRVKQDPPPIAEPARNPVEAYCVGMLLRYPELLERASRLRPDHFSEAPTQEIYRLLSSGAPIEDVRVGLDTELQGELEALLEYPLPPANYRERELGLEQCIARLEKRLNDLQQEALSEQYAAQAISLEEASVRADELKAQRAAVDRPG